MADLQKLLELNGLESAKRPDKAKELEAAVAELNVLASAAYVSGEYAAALAELNMTST